MKIESSLFLSFLRKVTLNSIIRTCVLDFREDGLFIRVKDISGGMVVRGLLPAKNFVEYQIQQIPVIDTEFLIKAIGGLKNTLNIKIENDMCVLSDENKKINMAIGQADLLENHLEKDINVSYDKFMALDSGILREICDNIKLFKDSEVRIEVKNNILFLKLGREGFNNIVYNIPVNFEDNVSKYGSLLKEIASVLTDKIEIAFKKDFPLFITEKNNYEILYIMAPLIDKQIGES